MAPARCLPGGVPLSLGGRVYAHGSFDEETFAGLDLSGGPKAFGTAADIINLRHAEGLTSHLWEKTQQSRARKFVREYVWPSAKWAWEIFDDDRTVVAKRGNCLFVFDGRSGQLCFTYPLEEHKEEPGSLELWDLNVRYNPVNDCFYVPGPGHKSIDVMRLERGRGAPAYAKGPAPLRRPRRFHQVARICEGLISGTRAFTVHEASGFVLAAGLWGELALYSPQHELLGKYSLRGLYALERWCPLCLDYDFILHVYQARPSAPPQVFLVDVASGRYPEENREIDPLREIDYIETLYVYSLS